MRRLDDRSRPGRRVRRRPDCRRGDAGSDREHGRKSYRPIPGEDAGVNGLRFSRKAHALGAVATLFVSAAIADDSGLVEAAERALSEGFPQVAIRKVQAALAATPADGADRGKLLLLLAEAQRAGGHRQEALATIDQSGAAASADAGRLRGDILASDARWEEALAAYRHTGASGGVA